MTPFVGFLVFLAITLAFLGGVVVTGRAARRSLHIPLVACAVASLLTTIYFAEQLGQTYDLESAGAIYPIHIGFAVTTTCMYAVPILTGIVTLKKPRLRKFHAAVAWLVIGLTVITAVTGTWMLLAAEPL